MNLFYITQTQVVYLPSEGDQSGSSSPKHPLRWAEDAISGRFGGWREGGYPSTDENTREGFWSFILITYVLLVQAH